MKEQPHQSRIGRDAWEVGGVEVQVPHQQRRDRRVAWQGDSAECSDRRDLRGGGGEDVMREAGRQGRGKTVSEGGRQEGTGRGDIAHHPHTGL